MTVPYIHRKTHLADSDNLTYMYLRDALKDGPARRVVSGLTQICESYMEFIVQERYDRLRAYYIKLSARSENIGSDPLKTGSGQELPRLHDFLRSNTQVR